MIRIKADSAILPLLLDRSEHHNAFDLTTTQELCAVIEAVQDEGQVLVLVIKRAGNIFRTCSDLEASDRGPYAEDDALVRISHLLHRSSILLVPSSKDARSRRFHTRNRMLFRALFDGCGLRCVRAASPISSGGLCADLISASRAKVGS